MHYTSGDSKQYQGLLFPYCHEATQAVISRQVMDCDQHIAVAEICPSPRQ